MPAARLTLHSERSPLTAAEVFLVVADIAGDIDASRVTRVELTFDLHRYQADLAKAIFSIAQKRTQLTDERGWRTNYVGGPKSEREICIYKKTSDVARVELVLRRRSLLRRGITFPRTRPAPEASRFQSVHVLPRT